NEVAGKGHTPQSRPAHMAGIDLVRLARTQRLLEGHVDEADLHALRADDLGGGGVLGDVGGQRANAAGPVEHLAAPHHVLSLREAYADGLSAILPESMKSV